MPFPLTSTARREPLRVGLLLESTTLPAWAVSVLDQIDKSSFAGIEVVILNGATPKQRRASLLYQLYSRWDAKRCAIANDPMRPVDCSSRLEGIRRADDPSALRSYDLDVILSFGPGNPPVEIAGAARCGAWSHHDGGDPPYFWEVAEHRPLSGASLVARHQNSDLTLCGAELETQQGVSVARNRVQPYWTASLFAIRKLWELHERGWESVVQSAKPARLTRARTMTPTNIQMLRFLGQWAFRQALPNRLLGRPEDSWRVAIRAREKTLSPDHPDTSGFRWIAPAQGHYYADPFVIEKDGKSWLFFEDYSYDEGRGVIARAEISPDGQISNSRTVLATGYHLSYPFVFEHDGEMYMIPESAANRTVELYRAEQFPDRWRLEKVLLSGWKATDTTLWEESGTYWFFTTLKDPPEAGPQLFLFYADSLGSDWNYHPCNPICSDARFARGAGKIFRENGRLIRPSQDHSRGYGSALHFCQISELTKTSYREVPLGSIEPTWEKRLRGVHTYNRSGRIEVIDANRPAPPTRRV